MDEQCAIGVDDGMEWGEGQGLIMSFGAEPV
jgi:hypothetical protein